jgi:hypothetical protein
VRPDAADDYNDDDDDIMRLFTGRCNIKNRSTHHIPAQPIKANGNKLRSDNQRHTFSHYQGRECSDCGLLGKCSISEAYAASICRVGSAEVSIFLRTIDRKLWPLYLLKKSMEIGRCSRSWSPFYKTTGLYSWYSSQTPSCCGSSIISSYLLTCINYGIITANQS